MQTSLGGTSEFAGPAPGSHRRDRFRRRAVATLGGLTLLVCAFPTLAQTPASSSPAAPTPAADPARVWWNQARFIDALELTTEQRQAMDAALASSRAARQQAASEYRAAREAFAAAISGADWEAAAAQRERLAELAGRLSESESTLVLDVVRQLTEVQRQKLNRQFPLLLRRPWLRGGVRQRTPNP